MLWISIVLAHWNNSPCIDISPHSVTLSWFRANHYTTHTISIVATLHIMQNFHFILLKFILDYPLPYVELELVILPEHLGSLPDFSDVRVGLSLVFCVVFFPFVLFLLAIALSVLLWFKVSGGPLLVSSNFSNLKTYIFKNWILYKLNCTFFDIK